MSVIPHTRPDGDYLFTEVRIDNVIQHRRGLIKSDIEELPVETVLRASLDDIAFDLAERHAIRVPELHEAEITVSELTEAKLDVSQGGRRFIRDRSRPFYAMFSPGCKSRPSRPWQGSSGESFGSSWVAEWLAIGCIAHPSTASPTREAHDIT